MKSVSISAPAVTLLAKRPTDTVSTLTVSGAYTGLSMLVVGAVDGSTPFNMGCINKATGGWVAGGTAITPVDGSAAAFTVPSENCQAIGFNITAVTGTVIVSKNSTPGPIAIGANSSTVVSAALPQAQYTAIATGTPVTLTGAQQAGANETVVNLTAVLAGAGTLNSATAAQIVAAIPNAVVGQSYTLRIINSSSGAFSWTLTTATGITLTGTMTIANGTWRDFVVTLTTLTAVTIQSAGTGTQS